MRLTAGPSFEPHLRALLDQIASAIEPSHYVHHFPLKSRLFFGQSFQTACGEILNGNGIEHCFSDNI